MNVLEYIWVYICIHIYIDIYIYIYVIAPKYHGRCMAVFVRVEIPPATVAGMYTRITYINEGYIRIYACIYIYV